MTADDGMTNPYFTRDERAQGRMLEEMEERVERRDRAIYRLRKQVQQLKEMQAKEMQAKEMQAKMDAMERSLQEQHRAHREMQAKIDAMERSLREEHRISRALAGMLSEKDRELKEAQRDARRAEKICQIRTGPL